MNPLVAIPQIVAMMTLPGMHVDWSVRPCGEINAYYSQKSEEMVVCSELLVEAPEVAELAVAHEMGHAIAMQLSLADELGSLVLAMYDPQALIDAAIWMDQHQAQDTDHGDRQSRGWNYICMADGSEERPASPACAFKFNQARVRWLTKIAGVYGS